MKFRFFRRIGNKIMVMAALAAFLGLAVMLVFYARKQENTILEQRREQAIVLNQSVIHSLDAVMITGSAEIARIFADRLKDVPGVADLRILRIGGEEAFFDNRTIREINERFGRSAFVPRRQEKTIQVLPADHPGLQESLREKKTVILQEQSPSGEPLMTFLTPIYNDKDCQSCHGHATEFRGIVKLTTSLASMRQQVHDTWLQAAQILVFSVLAVALLTYLLMRRAVIQPIAQVTLAMSQAAAGDLTQRVPVPSQDEVGAMAESFNIMLERLRETYDGLEQEQDKLSTIILSAQEGIVVTDRHGQVVLVNPAAERILEKTSQQIVESGFLNLVDDPNYIKAYLESFGADMPETLLYKNRVITMNVSTIQDENNRVMGSAAMFRDVTEEKQLEQQLRELSFTDGLTGLLNRRRMEEVLKNELSRASRYGQKVSLLLFDVDHFKKFNDRYGHDQGDRVLIAMARYMREHFRTNDMCCRYGGEEFLVIMPNTDLPGAFYAADRFRQKVADTPIDEMRVTITTGIAIFPRHGDNDETLLKKADMALYQGKQEGRNRVIMVPDG